jgi:hypothetical protein
MTTVSKPLNMIIGLFGWFEINGCPLFWYGHKFGKA